MWLAAIRVAWLLRAVNKMFEDWRKAFDLEF